MFPYQFSSESADLSQLLTATLQHPIAAATLQQPIAQTSSNLTTTMQQPLALSSSSYKPALFLDSCYQCFLLTSPQIQHIVKCYHHRILFFVLSSVYTQISTIVLSLSSPSLLRKFQQIINRRLNSALGKQLKCLLQRFVSVNYL